MEQTVSERPCLVIGRRERKKQRTRDALITAAFELFSDKGFEATTVEEIADAVDVSARTFFRYFASKDDVALTFQEEQFTAMLDAIRAVPADLPVISALRQAVVCVAQACESGERGLDTGRFVCMQQMLESSPGLLARSLEHGQKKQADLTEMVAQRMGVDAATDLRPHVVASAASCVFRATAEAWRSGATTFPKLSDAISAAFALVEEGLNYPAASAVARH